MEDGAEKSAVPYENDGTEESAALYRKDETEESQTRRVALTFDDGPNAVYTPMLLNGLKERGIKATFFLIGSNVEEGENRELVRKAMCWEIIRIITENSPACRRRKHIRN